MSKLMDRLGGRRFGLPLVVGGVLLLTLPLYAGQYYMHVFLMVFLNIILALSYRIFYITGLGSFCHIAFYAIGAYVSALVAMHLGMPFPACFLAGGAVAGILGIGLAFISRHTRGVYFFIVTFAFYLIVHTIIRRWEGVTGGQIGLGPIPSIMGYESLASYYYMALVFAGVTIFIMYLIDSSRFGRELMAIGDSEDLAAVIGIDVLRYRIIAFAIGSLFAGFAGSFLAHYIGYIAPGNFGVFANIYVLMWVLIGGERKLWGPIAGATLVTLIGELLRGAEELRGILFGMALVIVILVMPNGIVGLVDTWRGRRTPKQPAEVVGSERSKLLTRFFGVHRQTNKKERGGSGNP